MRDLGSISERRRCRQRGSQLVEAGLMLMPFLALAFVTMDAGWALFIKATLEHAVREGVRYAVTGQVAGGSGQISSIAAVVRGQSLGLLSGAQSNSLSVQFLDPVSLNPTSSNQPGNLVQVSVTNFQIAPLAPLLRSGSAIPVSVIAADVIEGSPGGVTPAP